MKLDLLASSADPTKVSLTVRGVLIGLIPLIMFVAQVKGIVLKQDDVQTAIDSIAKVVEMILTGVSGVMIVYGLLRKVFYWLFK